MSRFVDAQQEFLKKSHEKSMIYSKIFRAARAMVRMGAIFMKMEIFIMENASRRLFFEWGRSS